MSGKAIFENLTKRGCRGAAADDYARDLQLFHNHALLYGQEGRFFKLLKEAHRRGKRLTLPDYGDLLIDGHPVSDIVIV